MGVLAFGLAVAIYFASQPRKGTVEWHKREYLQAPDRQPLRIRAKNFWEYLRGSSTRHISTALLSYEDQAKHSAS